MFRMMVAGVKHMHDCDFIARDLHPTRIHLEDGQIKWNLIGMPYNFKKLIRGPNYTGHLDMTAPELLINTESISKAADIWALGCCLYFIVTKRDPFYSENQKLNPDLLKENILNGILEQEQFKNLDW